MVGGEVSATVWKRHENTTPFPLNDFTDGSVKEACVAAGSALAGATTRRIRPLQFGSHGTLTGSLRSGGPRCS